MKTWENLCSENAYKKKWEKFSIFMPRYMKIVYFMPRVLTHQALCFKYENMGELMLGMLM